MIRSGTTAIPSIFEGPIGVSAGYTPLEAMADAALGALGRIGLTPGDVDVCLTTPLGPYPYAHLNTQLSNQFSEYLGLDASFQVSVNRGGGANLANLELATAMIESGRAKRVLIVNGASTRQSAPPMSLDEAQAAAGLSTNSDFTFPYGVALSAVFAMIARRHMHRYGTTAEQIAQVVATAHEWGRLAGTTGTIPGLTVEDVLASPMVVSPYHELELVQYVDGSSAYVVTAAEEGRELNIAAPLILGIGTSNGYFDVSQADELATNSALLRSAKSAYEVAGIQPSDVDMFANYDCFPATQIIALESLGFAEEGKGGRFVQDGNTAPGGSLPTSTNGGMIVQGHPVLSAPAYSIAEAARQMAGTAEGRQIADCQIAVHATYVASSGSSAVVVLGNEVRNV